MAGWLFTAVVVLLGNGGLAGQPSTPVGDNHNSTAATNPPPWLSHGPLTMEEALQRALENDGRIASLQAAVKIARAQRLAATDIKDPELQGQSRTGGQSQKSSGDNWDNSRIGVGVFVPNPWLMVPLADARTADYQAAQADLKAAIWLLKCDVKMLFAQIDYLTNNLAFNADLVLLNGEVLNAVQSRVGQGAATATDLMTASRQYIQFQDDFDQAYHRYQLARRQLASLLDISPESFELATNPPAIPSLPEPGLTFQSAMALAVNSRSDLAAIRWRAQAAESSYHEVRNEKIPWITEVKAGYIDNSGNNTDNYWVGLAVNIPIFSWTKNHASDAALAKSNLAGVEETNGLRRIRHELHDALDELEQTRQQQTRLETSASPLITSMRQTLATLQRTPNIMPEQVAAAELQLLETLRLELNTRWQYQLALLNLERTLGTPLNQ
jgi:outer membrane protein TolC